ncbi:hypothetical protein E2C01_025992 [Portunus trituberculatus]|uniref:Uncharacterized protein n=1 Tax=Portunus trituberculatus TaxID=210409 RepID=A0A5B7EH74_PORTR|nr:hypothetical protein [Portunus trituberculatus]
MPGTAQENGGGERKGEIRLHDECLFFPARRASLRGGRSADKEPEFVLHHNVAQGLARLEKRPCTSRQTSRIRQERRRQQHSSASWCDATPALTKPANAAPLCFTERRVEERACARCGSRWDECSVAVPGGGKVQDTTRMQKRANAGQR